MTMEQLDKAGSLLSESEKGRHQLRHQDRHQPLLGPLDLNLKGEDTGSATRTWKGPLELNLKGEDTSSATIPGLTPAPLLGPLDLNTRSQHLLQV